MICLLVLGACGNPRIETTASLNESSWSPTPYQTTATDFIENSCPNTAVLHTVPSWNVSGMTVFAYSWGKQLFIAMATLPKALFGGVLHLCRGCEAVEKTM